MSTASPKNAVPRMTAIHVSVVAAFFDSGLRNAGTPSAIASTPVSATAPDENARSMIERGRAGEQRAVVGDLVERLLVHRQGAEVAEVRARQPDQDEATERDDVDVGRAREEPARLLQAAEVRQGHEHDEAEAEHDAQRRAARGTPSRWRRHRPRPTPRRSGRSRRGSTRPRRAKALRPRFSRDTT